MAYDRNAVRINSVGFSDGIGGCYMLYDGNPWPDFGTEDDK